MVFSEIKIDVDTVVLYRSKDIIIIFVNNFITTLSVLLIDCNYRYLSTLWMKSGKMMTGFCIQESSFLMINISIIKYYIFITNNIVLEMIHIWTADVYESDKWSSQWMVTGECGFNSSVGRASHRYRGGHGFESCWSPEFFFQASLFPIA